MARTYAEIQDLCEQMLQDTSNATYDTTELGYWIEESLKEFATYRPHLVSVVFQVESRTGSDTAGTSGSLTDTSKGQFVAGDVGKVVHNTTDDTWAVVETFTSTSVLVLNANIMATGENYEIYNKRCWNKRQIYVGDVTDHLWIDSLEYPIGAKRNWVIYDDVLEIDVSNVRDSDSTLSVLSKIDVLVRFAKPHRLNQMTDLAGELTANGTKGDTSIGIDGMGSTELIERGDEFHIEHHRFRYTITVDVTTSGDAATITFYPGLEAAATDNDDIAFVKSTLLPQDEEIFCHLVVARAVLSDNINQINAITKGGTSTWRDYQAWGERKLAEVIRKLELISTPRTNREYTRG